MARTTISAWFAPEFVSHFKASAIFNGIGVSKKQEATRCLPRHFDDTLVIFRSILRATSRPSLFADGHLNGSRLPPRNGRSRPQNYRPASRCRNADNFVRGKEGRHGTMQRSLFLAGIRTETRDKSLSRVRLGRMPPTIKELNSVLARIATSTIALRTFGRARSYG
jgi:hypothetical protein